MIIAAADAFGLNHPHGAPVGGQDEDEVRLAVLAALALRCLAPDPDWPWRDGDRPW